jgi:hypothetical protein
MEYYTRPQTLKGFENYNAFRNSNKPQRLENILESSRKEDIT